MNPSTALARTVVDELARAGVSDAVIAPGSRSAPLAMALHSDARLRLHVEIDERSAAFLAVGLAKGSGRPAVLVSTSGTATANFHPAVVEADHARVPLLVLTADRPPELRHTAANQTIDQVKLYGGSVRWFVEVGAPGDRPDVAYWRSLAARAVAVAAGRPPGPVHLNLGFREPLVPDPGGRPDDGLDGLDGRPGGQPWTAASPSPGPPPAEEQVERLADRVATAERGMLVAGDTTAAPEPLLALAASAGWPVIAEPLSSARSGDQAISTAHHLLACERFATAHRPDLVVRVGRIGLSRALLAYLDVGVPQVLIDPDGAWLDPTRVLTEVLAVDPASLCAAVAERLPAPRPGPWLAGWQAAERRARATVDRVLDAEVAPSEPRTARDLAAALPDPGVLVTASSMPVRDLDQFMVPRRGLRVLGNRGASGIDGFVSTALGVALAVPHPTAALAGDLSVLHDQNGFLVADRPSLVLVVVNNDGGGIFSFLPPVDHPASFERVFATPHGIDFARLAAVYAIAHTRVERAADLVPAVRDGLVRGGGVHLVEVRTDRATNVTLHRRVTAAVGEQLRP
ncbi:MAG TPA: 2-succinyl-5-enolpyruvyl-6-hydroxy-3-cyclohexene-1-carboxylic-acid synthase [Egibacteraceae bacterium]|nr:2-succinyl-5-enolpyruvyl-6-hydroxy-3-cyclohexene-1-carboxylic-acid synthase [Egibacteraceae bacterium]